MTQNDLRDLYKDKLRKEKQCYISKVTGINMSVLSRFKKGEIDLYPHLFEKLKNYLEEV